MSTYDATGRRGTSVHRVRPLDTAISLGSGDVPVLATPRIVAWLEAAAVAALGDLPGAMTTVGIHVSVDHTAPSLVGAEVRAEAEVSATAGPHIEFEVSAYDGEQLIARGTHTRVIVDRQRFLAKAGLAAED